ncbi:MAG: hypothetical protein K2F87_04855, partial [Muribaculaceae bacterium]|nr:hypothetical protein [Muribaculaceae bacterium]
MSAVKGLRKFTKFGFIFKTFFISGLKFVRFSVNKPEITLTHSFDTTLIYPADLNHFGLPFPVPASIIDSQSVRSALSDSQVTPFARRLLGPFRQVSSVAMPASLLLQLAKWPLKYAAR